MADKEPNGWEDWAKAYNLDATVVEKVADKIINESPREDVQILQTRLSDELLRIVHSSTKLGKLLYG
jgi:hypothetical protein